MTRLEWSRGRHGHAVKGLLVGAAIGGAALALLVGAVCDSEDCDGSVAQAALVGAGLGALPGAGIGALVKTHQWAEVPVSNVRVSVTPVRGPGVAVGLTLRW